MTAAPAFRFSVVVPAFNEADELPGALKALRQQDFAGPYEVIVVDNGSTDATAAVAAGFDVRVVTELQPGVCAARQTGTRLARGEIVVSTDADSRTPPDWLTRIDARFRAHPDAVAVAGPCRYADPPWWAAVFPPLYFLALGRIHAATGHLGYLTATNVAFVRAGFPGYDTTLAQGGDEMDLVRRLRRWGRIVWDADNAVLTSSRRMDQGLLHTLLVSFGYHYAWSLVGSRRAQRPRIAPAIRAEHRGLVRRRRRRWRVGAVVALGVALVLRSRRTVG